jgi:hypothetical protein
MAKKLKFKDESPQLRGHVKLEAFKGDTKERAIIPEWGTHTWEGDNLIVTVGKQMIMDRLFGLSAVGAMTRIGVGTSNTAAAITDTALTGGVFVAYDSTPTRSSLTVTCVATFGTGTANIVWAELGMDNSTTLLNRIAPIGPFTKTSAVSIVTTVQIVQS